MGTEKTFSPSLFKGFFTKQSVATDWTAIYNLLTCGALRELTEHYRTTREWRYKSALPSLTPACQLNGTGKEAADFIGPTHVSMADFDHLPSSRMEEIRALVNADPHTFLSYVTVSGEGLRIFFRYEPRNACEKVSTLQQRVTDKEGLPNIEGLFYGQAFLTGNCYYADLIGCDFDEKCANINRLSALCHDPSAFFNGQALPFVLAEESIPTRKVTDMIPQKTVSRIMQGFHQKAGVSTAVLSLTDYAVGIVEKHGDCYTKGNRNQYLMKCLMMMNKLGIASYEAERWALSYDLGEAEIRRIVRSCYAHTAEHGIYETPQISFRIPETGQSCKVAKVANAFSSTHTRTREDEEQMTLPQPPLLPPHKWPRFLQQIVECGETDAQRDILLLGALTVLGASLNRQVRFLYGRKFIYPCLQTFVVAPPASGKGALTWIRKLVEPIHNRMMDEYRLAADAYKRDKLAFEQAGRAKTEIKMPEQPPMKMFLIAGNNSATGVLENLMEAGGVGLMCESEADTVSIAIGTDYGHWSDTLRKAFDHDRLSFNRRTNHEYREISQTFLSVLLSGTPAQVQPLIPSAENGLFSRQIFYTMPATTEWVNQFSCAEEHNDLDHRFETWGNQWKQCLEELAPCVSVFTFCLTDTQQQHFNDAFISLFDTACLTMNGTMKSSVTRLAVNILRLMSIVAFLRNMEEERKFLPAEDIPAENIADGTATRFTYHIEERDFKAVLALIRPLYQHSAYILSLLPEVETVQHKMKSVDVLTAQLGMEFTSMEALNAANAMGICANTLKSHLKRLTQEGIIRRTKRGCYCFVRARV